MTTLHAYVPVLSRTTGIAPTRFFAVHLWLPLAGLLLASAVLMGAGGDQWIADLVYRLEGGQWMLKDHWVTSGAIHRLGKWLSTAAGVGVLLAAVAAWCRPHLRDLRWPLAYLAMSVAASTLLVSLLKSLTAMDCPWDLRRYGGTRALIGLFESRHGLAASGCFPAGHASAGYAWVALYFCALAVRPAWRVPGLLVGLGAGLVFGVAQQLRGAHFMSHDLWSLGVCWLTALALYCLLLSRRRQGSAVHLSSGTSA